LKAVVTGATSGIGREIAILLSEKGIETVIVGRREKELCDLRARLSTNTTIEVLDLFDPNNAKLLFEKHKDSDIIVNCAGIGFFGEFDKTDLDREIDMISLNVISLHVLTKLFYKEFQKRGEGKILNVASSAAYFVGPHYSSYYATKAYVHRLTRAISSECKKHSKNITVTLFCPGPVKTDFGKADGIKDGKGAISPEFAAKKALDGLFKGKEVVFPNFTTRFLVFLSKVLPEKVTTEIVYKEQLKKKK